MSLNIILLEPFGTGYYQLADNGQIDDLTGKRLKNSHSQIYTVSKNHDLVFYLGLLYTHDAKCLRSIWDNDHLPGNEILTFCKGFDKAYIDKNGQLKYNTITLGGYDDQGRCFYWLTDRDGNEKTIFANGETYEIFVAGPDSNLNDEISDFLKYMLCKHEPEFAMTRALLYASAIDNRISKDHHIHILKRKIP